MLYSQNQKLPLNTFCASFQISYPRAPPAKNQAETFDSAFSFLNHKTFQELSRLARITHRLKRMFRCQNCQTIVPAHTKAQHVVVESRHKHYPERPKAQIVVKDGKKLHVSDPGGDGWEIVREIVVCPDCACKLK